MFNFLLNHLFFLGLLFFLVIAKIDFGLHLNTFGVDGSYYFDIARNIYEGNGIATNGSLYHQGMQQFSHASPIYPLWPLLLGTLAHLLGIFTAATWVPVALYFATLITAYLVVEKILNGYVIDGNLIRIKYSTVFVYLLALHYDFFLATSRPYTEGLAYLLFIGFIYSAYQVLQREQNRHALLAGVWLALALLCRSQLIVFVFATFIFAMAALLLQRNRQTFKLLALFTAAFVICLSPWLFFITNQLAGLSIKSLLFFDQFRASDTLSKLEVMAPASSWFDYIGQRLQGFVYAYNPENQYSFYRTYLLSAYLAPLALLALLFRSGDIISPVKNLLKTKGQSLSGRRNSFILFFLLLAAAGYFSIHLIHKQLWAPWNFGLRHGLTCIFLFFAAFVFLCRQNAFWRYMALALLICSSYLAIQKIRSEIYVTKTYRKHITVDRAPVINWVKTTASTKPELRISMYTCQWLLPYTNNVGYHWIYHSTTRDDLLALFSTLQSDYLLLTAEQRKELSNHTPDFDKLFEIEKDLSPFVVYRFKGQYALK